MKIYLNGFSKFKMFVLTIKILPNNIDLHFFQVTTEVKWIYIISQNEPLLHNFKMKIETFTPENLLQYMLIEILPYSSLNENDIDNNSLDRVRYIEDRLYIDGIVNARRDYFTTYDDFTPDKWNLEWDFSYDRNFTLD